MCTLVNDTIQVRYSMITKICVAIQTLSALAFFQEFFSGREAKSSVMLISTVMLIFLLFSDQILGGGFGRPLKKSLKESQNSVKFVYSI